MRVVVPYVTLEPLVVEALARDGIAAVYADTSGPPDAYWRLLRKLWMEGDTLIVLEQDKVPAPGLLRELWDCPQSWCSTPVPVRGSGLPADYPTLSCTKFSALLMRNAPDLIDRVGELDMGFGEREWSRLDLAIAGLLSADWAVHWHQGGRVEHLHRDSQAA